MLNMQELTVVYPLFFFWDQEIVCVVIIFLIDFHQLNSWLFHGQFSIFQWIALKLYFNICMMDKGVLQRGFVIIIYKTQGSFLVFDCIWSEWTLWLSHLNLLSVAMSKSLTSLSYPILWSSIFAQLFLYFVPENSK